MAKLIVLVTIFFIANCSTTTPVNLNKNDKTEIVYTADHNKSQVILYFTNGIRALVDTEVLHSIPWGQAVYKEITPGKHNFFLYMNYMGKSAKRTFCLDIQKGQKIHIKYNTPFILTSKGNVTTIDLKTKKELTPLPFCEIEEKVEPPAKK
ncbi:MAG: hypothetical protein AAF518_10690 [Spirochaetota bacterium]